MNARIVKACAYCGSTDVSKDATARWSTEAQAWQLSDVMDDAYCEDCNGETSLVDRLRAEPEIAGMEHAP